MRIRWFDDISLKDRPSVGGKGGSLGELQQAGIRVPPGFVITTAAFDARIDALERGTPFRTLVENLNVADLSALEACSAELRARVEAAPLPQELRAEIAAAHARLCADDADAAVAIRSSATTEDATDASFAGLQDTYLWVKGVEETLGMVRRCWASLYSAASLSYRRSRGFPEAGVAMAVVVQRMVDARAAGVMFTRSPTSGDRSVITIEGAWGLGSAVVGGEVTPDQWVLGKITGEISVRKLSAKSLQHVPLATGGIEAQPVPLELRERPCLTDAQLQALREVGRKVERHYACAQDIEWALDRQNAELFVLQSRPETVWSVRESRPAAAAVANPLEHVMSIFGGRK